MKKSLFIQRSFSAGGSVVGLPSFLTFILYHEKNRDFAKRILYLLVFTLFNFHSIAQQGEWTWMSGANTINGTATYGTQGIPSVNNHPSGLYEACEWTDTSGMFWLYGGSSQSFDAANLWKYDPNTNEWTWVKGPGNSYAAAVYGTQGVGSATNTPGSRGLGITTFTGKDGNLWLFGGNEFGSYNDLWKYDISTGEWTWVKGPNTSNDPGTYGIQGIPSAANVPPARSECSASWVDSTGNFWLFGGWSPGQSFNDLWKYDPISNEWTWMKGSSSQGAPNVYGTKGVSNSTNTPGARNAYTKWNDGHNNLYLFAGDAFALGELYNDVWKYSIATNEWVWISGTNQPNSTGNVSAQCSPDTNSYPSGRRESRACWVDSCMNFWFYGGSSQSSFQGSHNDLWKFDPVTLEWTWVSGSQSILQTGNFGTQGVSSPANQPPSRSGNNAWVDKTGNLWLFGGTDEDWPSAWNDMWRFVPDTLCVQGSCYVTNQQQINFAANDNQVCQKYCVDFFDSSLNDPTAWLWSFPGGAPASSADQNPTDICYNLPGVYDVTLTTTNANGTSTLTLSNYITVYATPPFPTITQVGYTLTSSFADSYQWQFNSADIPGATNQSYSVLQTGLYAVVVTDSNDCVNSANKYVLITGIHDVMGHVSISIYPNPTSGRFTIELMNLMSEDEVSIDVINTLGQEVFSSAESRAAGPSEKKEIDLSGQGTGIYFIQLKINHLIFHYKILISQN